LSCCSVAPALGCPRPPSPRLEDGVDGLRSAVVAVGRVVPEPEQRRRIERAGAAHDALRSGAGAADLDRARRVEAWGSPERVHGEARHDRSVEGAVAFESKARSTSR